MITLLVKSGTRTSTSSHRKFLLISCNHHSSLFPLVLGNNTATREDTYTEQVQGFVTFSQKEGPAVNLGLAMLVGGVKSLKAKDLLRNKSERNAEGARKRRAAPETARTTLLS